MFLKKCQNKFSLQLKITKIFTVEHTWVCRNELHMIFDCNIVTRRRWNFLIKKRKFNWRCSARNRKHEVHELEIVRSLMIRSVLFRDRVSLESLNTRLAALGIVPKGQGMWRDRYTLIFSYLLSFSH